MLIELMIQFQYQLKLCLVELLMDRIADRRPNKTERLSSSFKYQMTIRHNQPDSISLLVISAWELEFALATKGFPLSLAL